MIKARPPQTNGMIERFNGRISEVVQQTRFGSIAELKETLLGYMTLYNHHIPQRALNHRPPMAVMKEWQHKAPELFVKRVYKQAGPDK